jgi:hypothetical protein
MQSSSHRDLGKPAIGPKRRPKGHLPDAGAQQCLPLAGVVFRGWRTRPACSLHQRKACGMWIKCAGWGVVPRRGQRLDAHAPQPPAIRIQRIPGGGSGGTRMPMVRPRSRAAKLPEAGATPRPHRKPSRRPKKSRPASRGGPTRKERRRESACSRTCSQRSGMVIAPCGRRLSTGTHCSRWV